MNFPLNLSPGHYDKLIHLSYINSYLNYQISIKGIESSEVQATVPISTDYRALVASCLRIESESVLANNEKSQSFASDARHAARYGNGGFNH